MASTRKTRGYHPNDAHRDGICADCAEPCTPSAPCQCCGWVVPQPTR